MQLCHQIPSSNWIRHCLSLHIDKFLKHQFINVEMFDQNIVIFNLVSNIQPFPQICSSLLKIGFMSRFSILLFTRAKTINR